MPAQAGIQFLFSYPVALGPRFRGDERNLGSNLAQPVTRPHLVPRREMPKTCSGSGREHDDHAIAPPRSLRLFGHRAARELRLAGWQTPCRLSRHQYRTLRVRDGAWSFGDGGGTASRPAHIRLAGLWKPRGNLAPVRPAR